LNANFEKMCRRTGGYSLPWLIKIADHDDTEAVYLVNDVANVVHGGTTYVASTFEYTPAPESSGFDGGGTLNVVVTDNALIELIETYYNLKLEVLGVLLDDGTVSEVKSFASHYGRVTWDGKKASFQFERDDRLDMTFPALIFSHYNNRGNA